MTDPVAGPARPTLRANYRNLNALIMEHQLEPLHDGWFYCPCARARAIREMSDALANYRHREANHD